MIWGHTLSPKELQPPLTDSLQPRWAWLGTGSSNLLVRREGQWRPVEGDKDQSGEVLRVLYILVGAEKSRSRRAFQKCVFWLEADWEMWSLCSSW